MKPEFFPYFWIIYVNYVLYKRYKENKHLKKYEIILAIVSSIIISGGHFFMIYLDLSKDIQFIIDIFFSCVYYNYENGIWGIINGNNKMVWV